MNKDIWYLPLWWSRTGHLARLEQYLSFMHNVQGIMTPPDLTVYHPSTNRFSGTSPCPEGIIEANKTMERLGPIFTVLPRECAPVAVLYAFSARVDYLLQHLEQEAMTRDRHLDAINNLYLAGQLIHYPLCPVVEEDVLDGSLAAQHKAVILAGLIIWTRR